MTLFFFLLVFLPLLAQNPSLPFLWFQRLESPFDGPGMKEFLKMKTLLFLLIALWGVSQGTYLQCIADSGYVVLEEVQVNNTKMISVKGAIINPSRENIVISYLSVRFSGT
jgi:hypothetical protein